MDEPRRRANKKKRKLIIARRVVLLILIVCVVGISIIYRKDLTLNSFRRLVSYIDIGGTNGPVTSDVKIGYGAVTGSVCSAYKKNVVVLSKEYLRLYDNIGSERASITTGYNNPALETSDKYLLVYDRGGSKLSVINGTREIFSKTFDNPIISASVNENGFIGVVTGIKGYKAMVIIFDSSFNELYRCYSYDNYVLDVAISPDNENMSLITLHSKDGMLVSSITMYSFFSDKPTSAKYYEDTALYKLSYINSKKIAVIGEEMTLLFNKDGEEKAKFDYGGAKLISYSTDTKKYTILVLSKYSTGSRSTIIKLNEDGETEFETPVNYEIKGAYSLGNSVYILGQNSYYVYGVNGELKNTVALSNDVRQIVSLDLKELLLISPAMVKIVRFD